MDQQKKQKVMIGVLAACALGAGTFWWMNSKGSVEQAVVETGPVERRKREGAAEQAPKVAKKSDASKTRTQNAAAPPLERRQREEQPEQEVKRRERDRKDEKKEKKVVRQPAA